jgi:hypothetical protein
MPEVTTLHRDDPNSSATVWIGLISVILLLLIVMLLQVAYYHSERKELEAKAAKAGLAELQAVRAEQEGLLEADYRWLDREQGLVGLPIDRAMELVADGRRAAGGE